MARLAICSDLHYDTTGKLTSPAQIEALAESLRNELVDAIVLAGDLAHGLDAFVSCIRCFTPLGPPVAVLAGNHDVWKDRTHGIASQDLWEHILPKVTQEEGAIWLEDQIMTFGDVGLVGSIAWYDYSAIGPECKYGPDDMGLIKLFISNDARYVNWPWDDRTFAKQCQDAFLERLQRASEQVEHLCVVTHVPVLRAQIPARPNDPDWSLMCTFLGNYTFGEPLLNHPKVRTVVSGHLHLPIREIIERSSLPPIEARVIGSHYRRPVVDIIEISENPPEVA